MILVICLILMIVGLLKLSQIVSEANGDRKKDKDTNANTLDATRGKTVDDFDPKAFVSKEEWIQRVKDNTPAPVISIAEVLSSPREAVGEDVTKKWDRRYFSIFTRHSSKPIEETEAKYRLEKNTKTLASLKESLKQCEESIKKRIEESGDNADDTRLAELRMQLDGYQVTLANTEMDIVELRNRIRYISMFCTNQGSIVDPHEVVCCPNPACGSLLLSKEDNCPFCGTKMPLINPAEDAGKDSDGDGLPDDFELAHAQKRGFLKNAPKRNGEGDNMGGERGGAGREGSQPGTLDIYNPADANEDFDGDSFTNLEEYRFGTDIDDERSFPAPANYVRLDKFERDKLPFKLMGINDGRAGRDQKATKWRARFSFMRKIRGREVWERNEDNFEQVRIGKKFETPDGKEFILEDVDEEDVNGKKVAVAVVKDYIRPVKPQRRPARAGEAPAQEAQPPQQEAKTYKIYQDTDAFYDTMYAHLVYFVSRNEAALNEIYTGGRLVIQSGAKTYKIQTRFKLEEGAVVKLVVPVLKRDSNMAAPAAEPQKQSRLNRLRNQNAMGGGDGGRGGDMERGGGMTSQEYELREFEYKLTKFNIEAKKLVLVPADAKDASVSFEISAFNEDETYKLPDKRDYPLFYEGGSSIGGGMGGERGGDGMERGGRPMPDDMMRRGGPRR